MTFIHPAADSRHIIQRAMNSKTLATLAEEEDTYQMRKGSQTQSIQTPEPPSKKYRPIYSKEDIQNFKLKCQNKTPDEIFELLGIDVKYNEDGTKNISHYRWPHSSYSFQAAGINEEELLQGVKYIQGNCNLTGSYLKNLGDVKSIGGNLTIPLYSKAEDLSSIDYIGGNIICDSESQEDVIKLIKKLNLNPKSFNGHINPTEAYRYYFTQFMYPRLPHNMDEAIKELQAGIITAKNNPVSQLMGDDESAVTC